MSSQNGKNGHNGADLKSNLIWLGVGVGTVVGVAVVMNRRKKDPWTVATKRVAANTSDLAAVSKDIIERVRIIYGEARKVAEEATDLWAEGRKLVGA